MSQCKYSQSSFRPPLEQPTDQTHRRGPEVCPIRFETDREPEIGTSRKTFEESDLCSVQVQVGASRLWPDKLERFKASYKFFFLPQRGNFSDSARQLLFSCDLLGTCRNSYLLTRRTQDVGRMCPATDLYISPSQAASCEFKLVACGSTGSVRMVESLYTEVQIGVHEAVLLPSISSLNLKF